jgi:hypothetical protein
MVVMVEALGLLLEEPEQLLMILTEQMALMVIIIMAEGAAEVGEVGAELRGLALLVMEEMVDFLVAVEVVRDHLKVAHLQRAEEMVEMVYV